MKTLKGLVFGLSLALILILTDGWLFRHEWTPIFWHATHGFHIRQNGIDFRVPLFVEEDHGTAVDTLAFWSTAGMLNKQSFVIFVHFHGRESLDRTDLEQLSFHKTIRTVTLARRTGPCAEYVDPMAGIRFRGPLRRDNAYIYCDFGNDLHTSFLGSQANVKEFYSFIADAVPVAEHD